MKHVAVVISSYSNIQKDVNLKFHPLIVLSLFLAKNAYQVSVIVSGPNCEINENDQKYLDEMGIEVVSLNNQYHPNIPWLRAQFQVFQALKAGIWDLVIGESKSGTLALYANFGPNSVPVLTYLEDGIYLEKIASKTSFASADEIIRAALEDLQLKKSSFIFSNSQETISIYGSMNKDLSIIFNPINLSQDSNHKKEGSIQTQQWENLWIDTIETMTNEVKKPIVANTDESVSLIISTKNREKFLPNALASCVGQLKRPLEIIVVDDGSDSPTQVEAIVEKYASLLNITLIRNQSSVGQAKSRNHAAGVAQGNFLAFLDDDNFLLPNHLELCTKVLVETNAVAVSSFMNLVYSDRPINSNSKIDGIYISAGDHFSSLGNIYNLICDTHMMIRKNYFMEIGGFPDLIRGSQEDWGLGLKILSSGGKFLSTGIATIMYRVNNDGVSAKGFGISKWWPLHASEHNIGFSDWWFYEFARLGAYRDNQIIQASRLRMFSYAILLLKRRDFLTFFAGLKRYFAAILNPKTP